jgi:hypothetical protein
MDRKEAHMMEARWSSLADGYTGDGLEIMVVDDITGPTTPDLSDWGDPNKVGLIEFEASPKEVRRGERYCNLAIFFYKYWKVPFFRYLGDWCTSRAFWFTDGQVPIGDPGRRRDIKYLTGRGRT